MRCSRTVGSMERRITRLESNPSESRIQPTKNHGLTDGSSRERRRGVVALSAHGEWINSGTDLLPSACFGHQRQYPRVQRS
jgi:hypothetical protein